MVKFTLAAAVTVVAILDSAIADDPPFYEATCRTTGPYELGAPTLPIPVELVGEVSCTNGAVPSSYWSSPQFELISNKNRGGNGDVDGISTGLHNFQIATFPAFQTFDVALHVECHIFNTALQGNSDGDQEMVMVATNQCWTSVTLEKEPAPIMPTCNATSPGALQDIVAPQAFPVVVTVQGSATCSDGSLPTSSSMTWTILPSRFEQVSPSDQIQLSTTTRTDNGKLGSTATAVATMQDYGDYEVCLEVLCVDVVNRGLEYQDQCCSKIGVLHTPRMPNFCPAALPASMIRSTEATANGVDGERTRRARAYLAHRRVIAVTATADDYSANQVFGGTGLISQHACDFIELDAGRALNFPSQERKLIKYYPYIRSIEPYNTITNDNTKNPINVALNRQVSTKALIIQDENTNVKKPKQSPYGGCIKITFNDEKAVAVRDFGLSGIPTGQFATITLVHISGWETTLQSPDDIGDEATWIASTMYHQELSELTASNLKEMHVCIPSTGSITFINTSVCDEDYSVEISQTAAAQEGQAPPRGNN